MTISLVGLNPHLANLIQSGTIERLVHEALVSETLYRIDVTPEEFGGKIGESKFITRTGLLPVSINPLDPSVEPTPKKYTSEAFETLLRRYGDTADVYLPHDYVSVVKESSQTSQKIAINAAQTLDRLARAAQYRAYLAGNTVTTVLATIGAVQIHVASLNGFTEVNSATDGRPVAVSSTNPLTVSFGGTEPDRQVIAFNPDDADQPLGPGWLTLSAALTAGLAAREAVLAENRSTMIFAGGGNSVDAIVAGDTLGLQDLVNAAAALRRSPKVPAFEQGLYHGHISPDAEAQVLLDTNVRNLVQRDRIPDMYQQAAIGALGGSLLLRNSESPNVENSGTLVSSSAAGSAECSPEIGGELINDAGVEIGYTFIYGKGACYEEYVPPGATSPTVNIAKESQAEPAMSSGVSLNTDRIDFIIRPPLGRLNDEHAFSWKFLGDFVCATDSVTQAARYRRGVMIVHAV